MRRAEQALQTYYHCDESASAGLNPSAFHLERTIRPPRQTSYKVNFNAGFPPIQGAGQYDLRAVLQHRGDDHPTSTNSGHYTAYVRASDADWYHCDDAKPPRRCENGIADVLQAQAYMLFYEQR